MFDSQRAFHLTSHASQLLTAINHCQHIIPPWSFHPLHLPNIPHCESLSSASSTVLFMIPASLASGQVFIGKHDRFETEEQWKKNDISPIVRRSVKCYLYIRCPCFYLPCLTLLATMSTMSAIFVGPQHDFRVSKSHRHAFRRAVSSASSFNWLIASDKARASATSCLRKKARWSSSASIPGN